MTEAEESETIKSFAYILFYRQRRKHDILRDDLTISESDSDECHAPQEYLNGQRFASTLINSVNKPDGRNIVCYTDSDDPETLD